MKLLKNTWYCATWSELLDRKPMERKFLGEPIVMYRKESGEPVALGNRCRHRFAPMLKGCLKGDSIECPYHGLRFNAAGACEHNPHGDGHIPQAARHWKHAGSMIGSSAE